MQYHWVYRARSKDSEHHVCAGGSKIFTACTHKLLWPYWTKTISSMDRIVYSFFRSLSVKRLPASRREQNLRRQNSRTATCGCYIFQSTAGEWPLIAKVVAVTREIDTTLLHLYGGSKTSRQSLCSIPGAKRIARTETEHLLFSWFFTPGRH